MEDIRKLADELVKKPPPVDTKPYPKEDIEAFKNALVEGAYFCIWTRRTTPEGKTPGKWLLWIGQVVHQVESKPLNKSQQYPWVNFTAYSVEHGKAPSKKSPFPIDGSFSRLCYEYTSFVSRGKVEPSPDREEAPEEDDDFPDYDEVSQLQDGDPFDHEDIFPEHDPFDPVNRMDNRQNGLDPAKWQLMVGNMLAYTVWWTYLQGMFKGCGQNAEDNKNIDRVLSQVRANGETVISSNGQCLRWSGWVRKARTDIVYLNSKWKVKHGMAKEMQREYLTNWEQDVDPDYLRELEARSIQTFKINHSKGDNQLWPHRGPKGEVEQHRGGAIPPGGGHRVKKQPVPHRPGPGGKKTPHPPPQDPKPTPPAGSPASN